MEKQGFINKRNVILMLICIALVACLIIYMVISSKETSNPDKNVVTISQVARAVSLIYHTSEECGTMEDYFDGASDEWYVPYMNAMYSDEFYLEKDIKPTDSDAGAAFTYEELERLLTNVGVADKELWAYVNNNKASNPIVTKEWNEIYAKLVKLLDSGGNISEKNFCIVGTVSNVPLLEPWHAATTAGDLIFTGISVDYYIDKEVKALVKGNELLCVLGAESSDITYHNAWVITIENGTINAYIEGAARTFEIDDKSLIYSNVAADISLKNKKVEDISVNGKAVSGKVLAADSGHIELEGHGIYELSEYVKVYKTYGSMEMKSIRDILVGYDIQKFMLDSDGRICAAAIDRDVNAKNIRVLIRTSGFADIYHDRVVISSEGPMSLSYGSESKTADGGTTVEIDANSEYLKSGRLIITPQAVNGKICIKSVERGYGNPVYRGTIEIAVRDGRLIVINELPIEQYLYAVVPSEMPYTYSMEALKSQAVCARSYAYKHLLNNGLGQYGAHVDDSTAFQVYNNTSEKASATQAVDDTYGEIMTYGEEVVTAWFFSTSCGSTTNAAIWGGGGVPYIKEKILSEQASELDLSNEENFDTFIRNKFDSIDSSYPYYRWSLDMSLEDMTKTVNERIGGLYGSGPDKVLTMDESGNFVSKAISGIGSVKRVALGSRGVGGVLEYIVIYGTEATVKVVTEYYVRQLFYPVSNEILLSDGTKNSSFSLLPSAYIIMDPVVADGTITGYSIIGGGYGHGVGLSQNGANTLGNKGTVYRDILSFFYTDINITKIY